MVIPADLEKELVSIEGLIHQISGALVNGDPQALALASSHLRQGVVNFSQQLSKFGSVALGNPSFQLRLKQIALDLASRRESLLRQAGVVERSLNILVPASRTTTYAKAAGPYGAPSKSSGTFNFVAT
jgi:hypothetical protein